MRKGIFVILAIFILQLLPFISSQSLAICTSTSGSVKINVYGDEFSTIQAAYDYASAPAPPPSGLGLTSFKLLLSGNFEEALLINGGAVILDGGYNSLFSSKTSPTTLKGKITITTGSLTVAAGTDNPKVISGSQICVFDADGDGYSSTTSCSGAADDCNDNNAAINPGAVEIPYDGIDQDCNGTDMTFNNGNACVECHDPDNLLDAAHSYRPTVPDGTCAACHVGPVSSILAGHYGRIVRTTDNGLNAGTTIVCESCHDDGNHSGGFPLGDGNGDVWNDVSPPYPGNYTCDNCHANRAARHGTVAAHNNRDIDSSCASCHTSDTTVLGLPGSGTLTSQADVDALHRSDCTLCHAYTGTNVDAGIVRASIQKGLDGDPVSCLDCHFEHHSPQTNQVNYDPSVDTSQPTSEGCANCHYDYDLVNGTSLGLSEWETILVEHDLDGTKDGSPNTCANCHAYDGSGSAPLEDVQNAIASKACTTCIVCHSDKKDAAHGSPTSGKHERHLQLPGNITCSTCHAGAPYFKSGTDTNSDGLYDLSETDVCDPCHQDWDPAGLPAERDYKTGWAGANFIPECNYCHAEVVDNGDTIPAGGRRAVADEFPAAVSHAHYGSVLDSASCQVCHDHTNHSDGEVNLLDPDGGPGYNFVNVADITADPDVSDFCANCHDPDGATRLVAPLDPLDPFANGNSAPDVASRFMGTVQWYEYYGDFCFGYEGSNRPVNSHHDISDADQAFSGAKIECLDCHGAHTSALSQKLTDPFMKNVTWTGTLNEFCLSCHTGDHGPNDLLLPSDVSVPSFYTEPPANIPGEGCGSGMIYDCAGTCVAQTSVNGASADGSCDQAAPDLDCNIFGYDGGDCLPINPPNTTCDTGKVYDCADNCVDQATVDAALTNGTCDEVATLDLSCSAFNYDYESCQPCPGNDCSYIGGIDSCNYDFAPWWIDADWKNTPHGANSKRQWPGYSGAPEVPEMDCIACHDSHGSYDAATNPGGNPYMLRDYVQGSLFQDDLYRTSPIDQDPANWKPGTDGPVVITNPTPENFGPQLGNQFCVKCHSDWVQAYSWHEFDCTACLTCHSHGGAYDTYDWGSSGANSQFCP